MGIRFQASPNESYSEITLHVRFHQTEARLQQEVLGLDWGKSCLWCVL